MSITLNVTISGTIGLDAGPFDIYHSPIDPSNDGTLIVSGVSRATLLSPGQQVTVPDGTTTIRVRSTGTCTFYDDELVVVPTPTPTPTATSIPTYTISVYGSTNSALVSGTQGVRLVWRINSGGWNSSDFTCSSTRFAPSFLTNITVNSGDTLRVGLRQFGTVTNIEAGYSTSIPAGTTGVCGESSPQVISSINSSFSVYLNAGVSGGGIIVC